MKVFVTGATGLIGANSALELLQAGHELRLLVRNEQAARNYFKQHLTVIIPCLKSISSFISLDDKLVLYHGNINVSKIKVIMVSLM